MPFFDEQNSKGSSQKFVVTRSRIDIEFVSQIGTVFETYVRAKHVSVNFRIYPTISEDLSSKLIILATANPPLNLMRTYRLSLVMLIY